MLPLTSLYTVCLGLIQLPLRPWAIFVCSCRATMGDSLIQSIKPIKYSPYQHDKDESEQGMEDLEGTFFQPLPTCWLSLLLCTPFCCHTERSLLGFVVCPVSTARPQQAAHYDAQIGWLRLAEPGTGCFSSGPQQQQHQVCHHFCAQHPQHPVCHHSHSRQQQHLTAAQSSVHCVGVFLCSRLYGMSRGGGGVGTQEPGVSNTNHPYVCKQTSESPYN